MNIIGNILLIPEYSFFGAAIITLISQLILMIITAGIVLRTIKIPYKYIVSITGSITYTGILFILFWKF